MSVEDPPSLCTFAVTGRLATFQEIYICVTCSKRNICGQSENEDGESMPLCLCYNCAERCHEALGHEVEYYGRGPCYCDCASFHDDSTEDGCSCVLQVASRKAALELGIDTFKDSKIGQDDESFNVLENEHHLLEDSTCQHDNGFPFLFDSLTIPSLLPNETSSPCDHLIWQAVELVKHSSDTHWIPHTITNSDQLCSLEKLAYSIFRRHTESYGLRDKICKEGGIEWWVQVKNFSNRDSKKAPIDLHYDKDEELAEKFDIGSFPTLSTVTYLSGGIIDDGSGQNKVCAAPTLIFPHTYEMPDEGMVGNCDRENTSGSPSKPSPPQPNVIISHVRTAKHIVFDGRLLHGAPANSYLRQDPEKIKLENDTDIKSQTYKDIRVTFLVNIWLKRRPSKVEVLPSTVRDKIQTAAPAPIDDSSTFSWHNVDSNDDMSNMINMVQRNSSIINVIGSAGNKGTRMRLPFVSTGATWIDDEKSDEGREETGLMISMNSV